MRKILWALPLLAALALSGCGYNEFQTKDEQVKAAWAEVLNQYKRRADLIPNLVSTVQGYAAHEQSTLSAVTQARSRAQSTASPAQRGELEAQLGTQVSRVLALQERYPDLKASENFLALQRELTATEDRLLAARQDYNEAVRAFNTQIQGFPDLLLARPFGFTAREYFQRDADAAAVPRVGP